ncbi:insulin-degrading enzyme [Cylindrobasidium torrendii FP15055 ss-10]|uniref:Insulin-degrading enzyme n=1 Tax=Cylindrobasidium torrendii FP15055 ss-10 TaxID=1314674 RepID=A0A0D7AYJ1_9AGAR|nr:insulin-degrading enzyme [Cylindrobasidium torrendii FP15055 ss-10]
MSTLARLSLRAASHLASPITTTIRNMATQDWIHIAPKTNGVPPFSVFSKPLVKSQQDEREYRIIRLQNGLEATLIHDPKADKAAASLDVAVGHLSDPDDMPGLAHFCEHLLFMGTEKFPRENEYSEHLSKNNGYSNAYTSISNTNYYFSVATHALPQALARFSAFFHCPLFAPSCTSRELNAVDSEHKKNHQSDLWRIFQVGKHLSKPGHPWRKFGSGNRESLSQAAKDLKTKGTLEATPAPSPIPSRIASPAPSTTSSAASGEGDASDGGAIGRETRRRLIEWWNQEYCASRMHLCVLGKESLDELSELTSTLFSPIKNRGADPLPRVSEPPTGQNEHGTLVSVQTIMAMHVLELSFGLEYQEDLWRHKPAHFISHFIGHEGPGSVHSYLKNKGWISGLSSGPQSLGRGFASFKITAYLTDEGFKNHREVLLAINKHLSLMRSAVYEQYHQRELVDLATIKFRFQEKRKADDYVTRIAEHMARPYPRELLLGAPQLIWNWTEFPEEGGCEDKVREYLDQFRLQNGRVLLMAKKDEFEKVPSTAKWEAEPWYGTEYRVERFEDTYLQQANAPNDLKDLFLPGSNEFIPTNLDVQKRDVVKPAERPHLIKETSLSSLWHKKDDRFWVPKAVVVLDIRSPFGNDTARSSVLTRLYADLVTDSLTEFSYDADLAGLTYNFSSHACGFYISLNGYNDKVSTLAKHVLDKIKHLKVDAARLDVMKEQIQKSWENFFLGQSYSLSDYYARYMITEQQWTVTEKLKELPTITADEVQGHAKKALSQVHMRVLVSGNVYREEAIDLLDYAEQGLGKTTGPESSITENALLLPEGSNLTWVSKIPNKNQANSALTYYCHYGPSGGDQRLRVKAALLNQILSEPTFDTLRTKEQLGYIVSSQGWTLAGGKNSGLRIVVQSEKVPGYIEDRVESHLAGMKTYIEEMTPEVFEEQKGGLEKRWREAYKNILEEATSFMWHISTDDLDFLRSTLDADLLSEITKEDVLDLFLTKVHPASKTRAKLSVHMQSVKPRVPRVSEAAAAQFAELVAKSMPDVDQSAAASELGEGVHSILDFRAHWAQVLAGRDVTKLMEAFPRIMQENPVEGEGEDRVREGVTYITDPGEFRKTLKPAPAVASRVEWGDLPAAHL